MRKSRSKLPDYGEDGKMDLGPNPVGPISAGFLAGWAADHPRRLPWMRGSRADRFIVRNCCFIIGQSGGIRIARVPGRPRLWMVSRSDIIDYFGVGADVDLEQKYADQNRDAKEDRKEYRKARPPEAA